MNWKKVRISLIAMLLFIAFIVGQGTTYAADKIWMGVIPLMPSGMGYAINKPDAVDSARIWNIVQYDDQNSDTYQNKNIYCIKAGLGFTEPDENGKLKRASYDVFYNMKTQREDIKKYDALKEIIEGNIEENGQTINRYNAVLATLDMLYLPGESTENDKKQLIYTILKCAVEDDNYVAYRNYVELMKRAFSSSEDGNSNIDLYDFLDENNPTNYNLTDYALTDDEINAVQQAVLWYFTNYGTEKYNNLDKPTNWFNYTENGNNYYDLYEYDKRFEGENEVGTGLARSYQARILYNYMVRQAKANASKYADTTTQVGLPVRVDTTTLANEKSGSNYIIGPIHMTQLNTTPYTIDFKVSNKGEELSSSEYQLLDKDKKPVAKGTTVKDLVNSNFYLSLPNDKVESVKIDIQVNYQQTTMTLWESSENNQEQPLAEVKRENKSEPTQLAIEVKPEPEPEEFDLKLIKRITQINDQDVPERIKSVDVSKLNNGTLDENGKVITTADYDLNKEPIGVTKGDIVTYTFRIYNEGTIDGYAQEITEDVPEGLQFLWSEKEGQDLKADPNLTDEEKEAIEFNQKYLWGKFQYDATKENIIQISSDYLAKENEPTVGGNLIKAFGHNDGTKTENDLHYKELSVKFKVVAENIAGTKIRNEAAITEDCDKEGQPVEDRDSKTDQWVKYEDDEDYDNIILQSFDLALRKFIIAISSDTKIERSEELRNEDGSYRRAPVVDTSKLNTLDENGKLITTATYNHTKEPILVKQSDIVVYMLRVYNEGDIDGYASEIKDHLPPYLEFVEGEFNKQYGWELSEDGRTVTTRYLEDDKFLINKAKTGTDGKIELSYQEVPIMCKVKDNAKTSENITNIADITEYLDKDKKPVADRDSQENNVVLPEDKDLPGYKDKETGSYVPGQQDDDDFEKVIVKIFDLALRKWVTQAIVIENGQQTVTQTGHDAWDDPEAVVKVELHRKKLNQVTVKFRYSIRVYNQGEIEGYAKEVTDYIPEGLKFVAEDNPGWTDEGNNVISTRLLENTLLQPGEYADIEVLLTWINNENNMGVMNNIAEISEDYNKYGVPDIDSTPDNKKSGEDDIDDAPVMLSISTGQMRIYFTLGFIVLMTTASGIVLIKRYVL